MLKPKVFGLFSVVFLILITTNNVLCQDQSNWEKKAKDAMSLFDEGRIDEAFKLLKENYDEALKSNKEDSQLGNAINNLGELYRRINRLDQAELFLIRASQIAEKVSDKILEGAAKNNLGLTYYQEKKYDQAIIVLNEALKIRQESFGEDSSDVAITLDNLGITYFDKKDFAKGEEFTKKSLVIFEKKNGISHPDTILATANLAQFYIAQGKIEEALSLYQRQLDLTEKEFGADTEKLILPISKLISLLNKKIDFPRQEKLIRRNLTLLDKKNVAAYPLKVYYAALLGFALMKQNKTSEAEEFFKKSVNWIDVEAAKKSGDATNIAVSLYVLFLKENKRDKEAVALEEKIKNMFSK